MTLSQKHKNVLFFVDNFLNCRYGWDDQYYEYDESGEGWYQDPQGEWHQEQPINQSYLIIIYVIGILKHYYLSFSFDIRMALLSVDIPIHEIFIYF